MPSTKLALLAAELKPLLWQVDQDLSWGGLDILHFVQEILMCSQRGAPLTRGTHVRKGEEHAGSPGSCHVLPSDIHMMLRTSLASLAFRLDFLLENENVGLDSLWGSSHHSSASWSKPKLSPVQLLHPMTVQGILWQEEQSGIYLGGP